MVVEGQGSAKRQRQTRATPYDFMRLGKEIWSKDPTKANAFSTEDRKFREFFGCGPVVACATWQMIEELNSIPNNGTMEHFLWALLFMKVYAKENVMASIASTKPDTKTFQKWVWAFIEAIASAEDEVVS